MDHHAAFLQSIIADRDNDTPRLIYADWLEDNGDGARAEFIRVQCELAAMVRGKQTEHYLDPQDPEDNKIQFRLNRLRRRERELLEVIGGELARPVASCFGSTRYGVNYGYMGLSNVRWAFRRGFVAAVTLSAADWLKHADALCASTPLEEVTLTTWPGVAASGGWNSVTDIRLWFEGDPDPELMTGSELLREPTLDRMVLLMLRARWSLIETFTVTAPVAAIAGPLRILASINHAVHNILSATTPS